MKRFIFFLALLLSYGYAASAAALPDVIVTQFSYANGIFISTVKNQGTAATPTGVTIGVGYLVDGVHKTYGYVIGPLAAGASVTIDTNGGPYTIPNGTHTITAWVDDVNRFAESNKTNNQLSQSITVAVTETAITIGGIASPARLDSIKAMGARWVRFDLTWAWVMGGGPNTYDWSGMDSEIKGIVSRGMKPLATLQHTPPWARPANCTSSEACAPANASDYGNFAAAAARRYPQIQVWEIWNEPNLANYWQPKPDAVNYTALLKAAYIAIKAVNPNAIVLTGGAAPASNDGTNISPINFLQTIYNNGGGGSFDGVAHHPYCYDQYGCPNNIATYSAWSQMNDTFPSLRSVMIDHGDVDLKIWVTEFGAPTDGGAKAVTEAEQAQMVTNAYNLFRSYSWAGPILAWHKDRDICSNSNDIECFFGLIRYDGSNKPGYDAFIAAGIH
jgi:hypothetical protein